MEKIEFFLNKNKSRLKETVKDIVLFSNSYSMLSLYTDTTIVKSPEVTARGKFSSQSNRFIGEEFLLNYRTNTKLLGFRMGINRYSEREAVLADCHDELREDTTDSISLPKPKFIKTSLSTAIIHRRSIREYSGRSMSLEDLSTLLYYADGISGEFKFIISEGDEEVKKLRTAPSAGGMYPIDLYVVALNIQNLQKGLYQYYPYHNSLKPVENSLSDSKIRNFAEFGEIELSKANFILLYVYNFYVNSLKYGDSAVAYTLIEAGEISQNLQLAANCIGYGACDIGGYNKVYIEKSLSLDGVSQHVIHLTIVGKKKGEQQ